MNHIKHCTMACLLAGMAAAATALADTSTYQITTDTYIDSANASKNYGLSGSDKVVISTTPCRTLFDLPTALWTYSPGDIVSASVSFYVFSDNTATYNVSLSPLTTAFQVGTGTGTSPANGATWNTSDGTSLWTTPGGDYDSADAVIGTKGLLGVKTGDNNGRFFTWDITSLLINPTTAAELQDFGAILTIDTAPPASGQAWASFTSANSASYSAPYLPSLELTVVPEPSSSILVLLGGAGITCFLRKRNTPRQG
jgi:hypothetical protein